MTITQFSAEEVKKHTSDKDGWIIVPFPNPIACADEQVDDAVYDVSNFLDEHPGGKKILQRVLGQDASKQFWKYHNEKVMAKWGTPLKIGSIGSTDTPHKLAAKPSVPYSPPRPKLQSTPQTPSPSPTPSTDNKSGPEIFGEVLSPLLYTN